LDKQQLKFAKILLANPVMVLVFLEVSILAEVTSLGWFQ
jgi:hypothetical protein